MTESLISLLHVPTSTCTCVYGVFHEFVLLLLWIGNTVGVVLMDGGKLWGGEGG